MSDPSQATPPGSSTNGSAAIATATTATKQARPFAAAFLGTLISTGIINVIGFVSGILAARLLGPEDRGVLASIIYFPLFFGQLGVLGLHRSVAFEISRRPEDKPTIVASSVWLSLAVAIPLAFIGWQLMPLLVPDDKVSHLFVIRLFSLAMILVVIWEVFQGAKQGAYQFNLFNLIRIVPPLLYNLGIWVILAMHKTTPTGFAISYVISVFGGVLLGIVISRKDLATGRANWKEMTLLLERGLGFHLPQVLSLILERIDIFLVLMLLPDAEVGLYAVAAAVAAAQRGVGFAFTEVGFVKVAGETNPAEAKASLTRQVRAAQIILVSLTVIVCLVSHQIIRYGFGKLFLPAAPAAIWLICAVNIFALARIIDNGLRALGYPWAGAISYLAGLVPMIAGGILWVPGGGIVSMGQVAFGSALITLAVIVVLLRFLTGIPLVDIWGLRPSTVHDLYAVTRKRFKRR